MFFFLKFKIYEFKKFLIIFLKKILSFSHSLKLSFFPPKWQFFLAGKIYFTVKYLQCFSKFFSKGKVAE